MSDEHGRPTHRYEIGPCECGSKEVELEYGEPIRCRECGNIPEEIPPNDLEEPASYTVVIRTESEVRAQKLSTEVY